MVCVPYLKKRVLVCFFEKIVITFAMDGYMDGEQTRLANGKLGWASLA